MSKEVDVHQSGLGQIRKEDTEHRKTGWQWENPFPEISV